MINITHVSEKEYPALLTLWELSVRATHHFLTEQVITELKPLLLTDYFPAVTLICSRDSRQHITGFAGINHNKLEMLFIHPNNRGQGLGKALLIYAIEKYNVNSLDVNEQNPQAVGFYLHQGFTITGHSAIDGQGKPYPLLHMQYITH